MENSQRQLVQDVLSRIVATAAEHAALQNAFKSYSEGYDVGHRDAVRDANSREKTDADLIKMAEAYSAGCPVDRDFTDLNFNTDKIWTYKAIASRLKLLHVTVEDLDAIKTELAEMWKQT